MKEKGEINRNGSRLQGSREISQRILTTEGCIIDLDISDDVCSDFIPTAVDSQRKTRVKHEEKLQNKRHTSSPPPEFYQHSPSHLSQYVVFEIDDDDNDEEEEEEDTSFALPMSLQPLLQTNVAKCTGVNMAIHDACNRVGLFSRLRSRTGATLRHTKKRSVSELTKGGRKRLKDR